MIEKVKVNPTFFDQPGVIFFQHPRFKDRYYCITVYPARFDQQTIGREQLANSEKQGHNVLIIDCIEDETNETTMEESNG